MKTTWSVIFLIVLATGPLLGQSNSDAQAPAARKPAPRINRTTLPRGYVVLGGTYSGALVGGVTPFSRRYTAMYPYISFE